MSVLNITSPTNRVNLTYNQGETIDLTSTVTTDGSPTSLVGWTSDFRAEYADDDAAATPAINASIGSGITVASNVLRLFVQTSGLAAGRYNCRWRTVDAGGVKRDIFSGVLTLVEVPA